ncbi:MAG: transporter substrate-binding domain-containing protein [Woeseiaceae bacterium]
MNLGRRLFSIVMTIAVAAAATQASAQQTQQRLASESVIEEIKKRGAIEIGASLFRPWSMRDKNGELIGFDIDVGRKLAQDMGVDAEFVVTPADGLIPSLIAGKFDVMISSISITIPRNLTINFTQPYAFSGMSLLTNKTLTGGFELDDFDASDITFSARRGASPAVVIAEEFPEAQLVLFDDDGAAFQEVVNGNAHATMFLGASPGDSLEAYADVIHYPFPDLLFGESSDSIGLRKGDPDALNLFNNWIYLHTRSGWLQERNDYWFRSADWLDQVVQ